jgi:hypothetical protein
MNARFPLLLSVCMIFFVTVASGGPTVLPQSDVDPVAGVEVPYEPVLRPDQVPGKEYSDSNDKDANGVASPGQVVHWKGDGVTVWDSFKYTATGEGSGIPFETDALANCRDSFTLDLLNNKVPLLVSLQNNSANDTFGRNIYFQRSVAGGSTAGLWADWQQNINAKAGALDDLDGLETWGPDDTDDSCMYSRQGDPDVGGGRVSVYRFHPENGDASVPYLRTSVLLDAVIKDDGSKPVWGTGDGKFDPAEFDLDGLICWDYGDDDIFDTDSYIDRGGSSQVGHDIVVFSVRAIPGLYDGGEIFVLREGDPNATFLDMGGHTWNTINSVSTIFGLQTEEIDALEILPEPATLSLLVLGGLAILRRRSGQVLRRSSGQVLRRQK